MQQLKATLYRVGHLTISILSKEGAGRGTSVKTPCITTPGAWPLCFGAKFSFVDIMNIYFTRKRLFFIVTFTFFFSFLKIIKLRILF